MFPEHEHKIGTMIALSEGILLSLEMLLIEAILDDSEPRRLEIVIGLS